MKMKSIRPFEEPIYVTRPMLPEINRFFDKLKEIWETKQLTNYGPMHNKLEDALRQFLEVPHLSLFNNGTIALVVACQSLRLSGEVITTPFTFPATPHVLAWNNINPIFCDIDPVTLNINADQIESSITPQTTGILAVHIFGIPCDVEKIRHIADIYGLKIIYDAAHAFGVKKNDLGIGVYGDISMFSFHATKLFHTAEGGALTFKDKNLKKRIRSLQNFGIKNEEEILMPGINGKMNELQAAMGLIMLDEFEEEIKKRKILSKIYQSRLSNIQGVVLLPNLDDESYVPNYFSIRIKKSDFGYARDEVHEQFRSYNVFTRKYFYPLCSEYPCYHYLPSSSISNLPIAHQVANEVLCLPFYGELCKDDIHRICDILEGISKN